jgi:DNA (cytosine-5)-methyltransferase 1
MSGTHRERESAGGSSGPDFWSDYSVIHCRDGKARRVKSGLQCVVTKLPFVLVDGRTVAEASRVTLLKGFGNSIVPELAAVFIRAYMDISGIAPEYDSHPNNY